MLVGGSRFAHHRVAFLLVAVALFCSPAAGWYVAARCGWVGWPSGSKPIGFWMGVAAFVIILFEMLLWLRKRWRGRRLVATRRWMFSHIWLGLLSIPLALCHSGFALGGSLSATVLVLFLTVIASGVWGLIMQQIIPRKMLDEIPSESIVTEINSLMRQHLDEARGLMDSLRAGSFAASERAQASGVKDRLAIRLEELTKFFNSFVVPYLQGGQRACWQLGSRARSERLFTDLRKDAPDEYRTVVDRLESLCDERSQLDAQARLYNWLHGWMWIHVPLSWALVIVLVAHAILALKLW